ncbi:hypothetical protein Tsubulata_045548 [Turnera subulata]|uniref:Uncharacterized protein n=1 Tax=Turnera subulata TaxID=218843 RepID=A0A9Q0FB14_9ROSI|nr:hypothetical protein Tsubulata_045548 [Turnera subulata]
MTTPISDFSLFPGSGSCSGAVVEEEDLTGTERDGRYVFRRAVDGVVDDMVPLFEGDGPEISTIYVPMKVKKVYDLYRQVVTRSGGFDCDGDLYLRLPPHLRHGHHHPLEYSPVNHTPTVKKCIGFALRKHNKEKKTELQLKEILKENVIFYTGSYERGRWGFYITLTAIDCSSTPPQSKTCQLRFIYDYYRNHPSCFSLTVLPASEGASVPESCEDGGD